MSCVDPSLPTVREESASDPNAYPDIDDPVIVPQQHSRRFPIGSITEQFPTRLNGVLASDLIGSDPPLRSRSFAQRGTYIDIAMSTGQSFQMVYPPTAWGGASVTSDFATFAQPLRLF